MLPPGLSHRRAWILALQTLGMLSLVVALLGPLLGAKLVEFRQKGLDVFIAVDCSTSMLAQDFQPNRLAHAKLALGQLIDRLPGSRIGVMAFAGQAYVQCPLTIDQDAARDTLESLGPDVVPKPGTRIGDAIRLALKGIQAGEGNNRALILLTDGEDHKSDPLEAAKEAARLGVKVFAIGIGNKDGEPIPVFDEQGQRTGVKRDKKGEVVLSRLDEETLVKIARETGGAYFAASPSGDEIEPLTRALEKLESGDQKTQQFNRFENRFQWPLAVGILLLFITLAIPEGGFRSSSPRVVGGDATHQASDCRVSDPSTLSVGSRQSHSGLPAGQAGATSRGFILAISFLLTATAMASSSLKQGNRDFKNGKFDEALKKYDDALVDSPHSPILHFNAGAAAYQKGDFARAESEFVESAKAGSPELKAISHYNRGNALFRQERLDDAIASYKDALRLNPKDENAKYNLSVALQTKQNPPKNQKPKAGEGQPKDPKSGSAPQPNAGDQKDKTPKPAMSKEDAERLLSAAAAGERRKNQKVAQEQKTGNDDDW